MNIYHHLSHPIITNIDAMKYSFFIAFAAFLGLFAVGYSTNEATTLQTTDKEVVLEQGPEHEIEAKPIGPEEAIPNAKPEIRSIEDGTVPDSEIEAPAVKLADVKEDGKPSGINVSAKGYHEGHCSSKCELHRHSCPYGCKAKHCTIEFKIPFRKKYYVTKKYVIKVRHRVYIKPKCHHYHGHGYSYHGYHKKKCGHGYYKLVVGYKTKYKTEEKYKIVYKYKYKSGITCNSYHY